MLAESIVLELCLSGGLDRNIEVVREALRERCTTLVGSLRESIPEARFVVPGGGYFLWLDLADDVDTVELAPLAKEEGVAFIPGADFMLDGGRSSLRLSFASVPAELIPEGVERLARALERVRTKAAA
jgi:DNA-binding transcriptional MocR family regulator